MRKVILGIILAVQTASALDSVEASRPHTLIDIFCTAVVERAESRTKSLDEIWPELERHFETGILYSSLLNTQQLENELEKIKTTPLFKKCLDENQKEFEYGEFILSGRKIIKNTLQALQNTSQSVLSSASFQLGDSLGLPSDLSLQLADNQSNFTDTKSVESIVQREQKYNALWRRFIADVKGKSKDLHF